MTHSLPPGWIWVAVDQLANSPADITDGPFGSNLKTVHYRVSGPRVVRLQNIGDGEFVEDAAHIAKSHFQLLRKHEVVPGDVLVAMLGADLPRACLAPPMLGPAIVKADCVRLRPNPVVVDPKFVAAGLNSVAVRRQAEALVHGVGRPRLGLRWFRTLRFPLAPMAEQRRIIDAIESHVSRIDAAIASLNRVRVKLKSYGTSVLKAAVAGRLVSTEADLARREGRTYEPAEVLLTRILYERRRRWEESELAKLKASDKTPKNGRWRAKYKEPSLPDTTRLPALPEGWCWATLDQLSWLVRNGQSKAPREIAGVRILRISAVRPLAIDYSDVRYLPGQPEQYADDLLTTDDLLFTRYNGTPSLVGVCARVRWLGEATVHPDKLIKVRLSAEVDPAFLEAAANAGESRKLVERRTRTTAGQAGISGADLRQMPVPLPPYAEQIRISSMVDDLLSIGDKARAEVTAAVRRSSRLRQGVMQWAFEGKLADQDPADESAEQLLARIRAERAVAAPVKKTRGRRWKTVS